MATKEKKPKKPEPLDFAKGQGEINSQAASTTDARIGQLSSAFNKGTGTLAQLLNSYRNNETSTNKRFIQKNVGKQIKKANQAVSSLANNVLNPTALENQTSSSASSALRQPQDALLQTLNGQAASDLALGRSLSPEEQRMAAQAARSSTQATGFANSAPGTFAEVLNRDQFATQREAQRRAFAQGVEGQNQDATNSARSFAGQTNQAALQRQLAGTQLATAAANQKLATNPFMLAQQQQSMVPTAAGFTGQLINQADVYPQVMQYGAGVQTYNKNAEWNQYIAQLNRYYAQQAGGTLGAGAAGAGGGFNTSGALTGALGGAAAGATLGSVVPGVGTVVGGVAGGLIGGLGGGLS